MRELCSIYERRDTQDHLLNTRHRPALTVDYCCLAAGRPCVDTYKYSAICSLSFNSLWLYTSYSH